MTAIHVAHAGADYDVVVGDLSSAIPRLRQLADGRRLPLITDSKVFELYGRLLAEVALPEPIIVPQGEAAKDWRTLAEVVDQLGRSGVKRGTPIIAVGGGSVGDVGGLAASLFKRGCPIVHIPTTLLAQVDSAIGGKTAIDAAGQKNLIGAFHHPALVVADPALLDTLEARQLRSGYAEVVKYGLIEDAGFFAWCEKHGLALIEGDSAARVHAIVHCVRAKARIVSVDPEDLSGSRARLNLGHTFGHAIETLARNSLVHGEAVAIGMTLAFDYSEHLGLCPCGDAFRVRSHLAAAGLPTTLEEVGLSDRAAELFALMMHDKKATGSGVALILARGVGQAFLERDAPADTLKGFLQSAA